MERLPGSLQENRKQKPTCEEGSDSQPGRKRRKLETELSGMNQKKFKQGKKNEELRCVADPVVHLANALNAILSIGNISEVHRDGPRWEARTCPRENVCVRRNVPLQRWQFSFCTC